MDFVAGLTKRGVKSFSFVLLIVNETMVVSNSNEVVEFCMQFFQIDLFCRMLNASVCRFCREREDKEVEEDSTDIKIKRSKNGTCSRLKQCTVDLPVN